MKRIINPCSHIPLIFYINAPSYPSGHPVLCTSVLFSCFFTSSYHCFILTQSFMIDYGYITKKQRHPLPLLSFPKSRYFMYFFFLLIITPAATAKASAAIPTRSRQRIMISGLHRSRILWFTSRGRLFRFHRILGFRHMY